MLAGMRVMLCLVVVAGCRESCLKASPSSLGSYAVGTYVGGGSALFGKDECTYEGGPAVFMPSGSNTTPSSTPAPGPRFITAAGRILAHCPKTELVAEALEPTAAKMIGPTRVKRGVKSEPLSGVLLAGNIELRGEPAVEWKLGKDCDGVATFSPVLGAQDTGGSDRTRTLETTAAGTCSVMATLTTGTSLNESFKGKAFQVETLITVE